MNYTAVRSRYLDDAVATASPAKLLTMLYDRLVLDLERAESAQRDGDRAGGGTHLLHAQDIVSELASTLEVDAWDGARGLMSVYTYLLTELVGANVSGDPERTAACRELVEPLRDAWHEAADQLSGAAVQPGAPTLEPVGAAAGGYAGGYAGLGELGVG
jgi:flagellar protein FliS